MEQPLCSVKTQLWWFRGATKNNKTLFSSLSQGCDILQREWIQRKQLDLEKRESFQ